MAAAPVFRLTTLLFFAAATYGLSRLAGTLFEHGLPLALLVVPVGSAWLAVAVATVEAWLGRVS